ncbi:MAG: TMEM43 family protein [Rhodospirillaceae bacterium]
MTYDPAAYTQSREVGFGERIASSLIGIPLGIVLIFFPMSLLWWNEHRNVDAQQAIDLALELVISLPSPIISPQNDGKLVHVIGPATASSVVDTALGLTLPALVIVQRHVEMYQWRERQSQQAKTNLGGSQTITTNTSYEKVWSTDWLDSRNFSVPQGHNNPPAPARNALIAADDAKLGAFRLGPNTLAALAQSGLSLGGDAFGSLLASGASGASAPPSGPPGFQEIRPEKAPDGFVFDPAGGLFRGRNTSVPSIGDVRVTYSGIPSGKTVTVVAKQNGDGFTDYPVARSYSIQLAAVGEHSAQALLEEKAARESTLTWLLRLGGVIVMWLGFMMLLGPLATLVSVVPFLGMLAEGLTADIAFFLALILGIITVAVAWLVVHPIVSITLIIVTVLIGGSYIYLRRG